MPIDAAESVPRRHWHANLPGLLLWPAAGPSRCCESHLLSGGHHAMRGRLWLSLAQLRYRGSGHLGAGPGGATLVSITPLSFHVARAVPQCDGPACSVTCLVASRAARQGRLGGGCLLLGTTRAVRR